VSTVWSQDATVLKHNKNTVPTKIKKPKDLDASEIGEVNRQPETMPPDPKTLLRSTRGVTSVYARHKIFFECECHNYHPACYTIGYGPFAACKKVADVIHASRTSEHRRL
jgi:hypothetical protein